jgi:hypothetical protein
MCSVTGIRFPAALLSSWKLVPHPEEEDGPPWLLPADLTPSGRKTKEVEPTKSSSILEEKVHKDVSTKLVEPPVIRTLPTFPLLTYTSGLFSTSKGSNHQSHLFPHRWKENGLKVVKSKPNGKKKFFVWREDMPSFYLELLRQRVTDVLVEVAEIGRGKEGGKSEGRKKVIVGALGRRLKGMESKELEKGSSKGEIFNENQVMQELAQESAT